MLKQKLLLLSLLLFLLWPVSSFSQCVPVEKLTPILKAYETATEELKSSIRSLENEKELRENYIANLESYCQKLEAKLTDLENQAIEKDKALIAQENLLISSNEQITSLEKLSKKQAIKSGFIGFGIGAFAGVLTGIFIMAIK